MVKRNFDGPVAGPFEPPAGCKAGTNGAQHLADLVAYRRDRRKDQLLQENGYLVLRYLAEDLAKELDSVLDGILRSLSTRRKPGSMAIPITVVRGSRV